MFSSLTCEAVNSGWTGSSCSFWHDGFLWGPLCEDSISYISLSVTYEGPAWLNNDLRMIWFTCKQRKAWVERCTWIDNITGEINHKRWLNTGERIDLSIALQQHYSVNTQLKHLVRFFVSTLEATMDREKKKYLKKDLMPYWHMYVISPRCIFGFAQQQSEIWQPSIPQMALLFLLRTLRLLWISRIYLCQTALSVLFPILPLCLL